MPYIYRCDLCGQEQTIDDFDFSKARTCANEACSGDGCNLCMDPLTGFCRDCQRDEYEKSLGPQPEGE
jgi:hypothetical protein